MKLNLLLASTLLLSFLCSAPAQTGDRPGETQVSLIPAERIPPAPPLAPDEALKRFTIADGFEIQLVAAEPLIVNPVMLRWDAAGRLWVLEMRSFMPDAEGNGEIRQVSQVAILHDDDGDGRMDRKTVFLDNLLMPRAMAFSQNGVLICEPPGLYLYPILPGDKPGPRTVVDSDYAPEAAPLDGKLNVEHAPNGLARGMDNWFYSAKATSRYRLVDEEWKKETTYFKGQWGICQDNFGRLIFNSNSDHFRIEPVASEYLLRNPFHRGADYSVQPLPDQTVWPGRMNPGANRAYNKGFLRENGTMRGFTAASSIVSYRGAHFPPEFLGDVFVPEPAGNLVRRDDVTELNGTLRATNPYAKKQTEFLVSTDEIFRPVNAHMGPDGAVYLVDMYHGIIQHHAHLTSYLRAQSESRGLDKVTQYGRIYRVVHKARPLDKGPDLSAATPALLVETLNHANGWYRDTAQRLLVDRAPAASIALLKELARSGANHLGRLHALWTLEGLGYADLELLGAVMKRERHGKVLAAAIRLCDPILKTWEQEDALKLILPHRVSPDPDVRLQVALSLSGFDHPDAVAGLVELARDDDRSILRDAVISGMPGREAKFVAALVLDAGFRGRTNGRESLLNDLARCVITGGRRDVIDGLLGIVANPSAPAWQRTALVTGMTPPKIPTSEGLPPARRKRIHLPSQPEALVDLAKISDPGLGKALRELDEILAWPGKPGVIPELPVRPLTVDETALFDAGKRLYGISCGNCHQPHGFGMPGLAPPLADSEWIAGPDARLIRIALHGMTGPVSVLGRKYNMNMPGHKAFNDRQIAGILTYVRREWDHPHDPVSPAKVAAIRKEIADRDEAWTAKELFEIR
jgi:mono/diheme cytochrome c family protein/glucose/arabinose dehydrogenase